MKIKASILALALLGVTAYSHAAPSLQTCNPMEIVHNGTAGMSYTLACEAGGWKLGYSGSVPAGSNAVVAKYRLSVTNDRGENFIHSRQLRLPEPALLGQGLLREAVLLDNGDLALRACEALGCTQYRPLGSLKAGLTEATITGSQEIVRLKREVLRLDELASTRGEALAQAQADLAARQSTVDELQKAVSRSVNELARAKEQAISDRTALELKLAAAQAKQDSAEREAAAADMNVKIMAAQAKRDSVERQAVATVVPVELPPPATPNAKHNSAPDVEQPPAGKQLFDLDSMLDMDEKILAAFERLKMEHEETLAKLERAQNQAAMASARLEAVLLTQQLTAQTLTVAHSDLDAARHELAQLKRHMTEPASPPEQSDGTKDALLGRVTSALVNSNTEIASLKAELARTKASAGKSLRK